jgi:hypothetical protein
MILLCKSRIQCNNRTIKYEIFLTAEMLLFKPALYDVDNSSPFAIFTKNGSDWTPRTELEKGYEERSIDQIKMLRFPD